MSLFLPIVFFILLPTTIAWFFLLRWEMKNKHRVAPGVRTHLDSMVLVLWKIIHATDIEYRNITEKIRKKVIKIKGVYVRRTTVPLDSKHSDHYLRKDT